MDQAAHRERQWAPWWVHLLMGAILLGGFAAVIDEDAHNTWPIIASLALLMALIYALLIPMTVEVSSEGMDVRFGYLGWPRWHFGLGDIEAAQLVEFSPIMDYGGWGIRMRHGKMLLNQRGHAGVQFGHRNRTWVIGSDDPATLLEVLRRMGVDTAQ